MFYKKIVIKNVSDHTQMSCDTRSLEFFMQSTAECRIFKSYGVWTDFELFFSKLLVPEEFD